MIEFINSKESKIKNKHNDKRKKIIIMTLIILIFGWMAFIFYMSHQPASVSSGQSGGMINTIINMPIIGALLRPILTLSIGEFIIRKSAHMFLYFVLAILIFNFLSIKINKITSRNIIYKNIIISILLVFLYACTDEIHQLFIPGRSGEFRDVMVDTFGGLIGVILITINYFRKI